jgi:hypothetical protein
VARKMLYDGPGLDPMCYRSFPFRAVVKDSVIKTEWHIFRFAGDPYDDGTEVEVTLGRDVECLSVEEKAENDRQLRVVADEWTAKQQEARAIMELQNTSFNDSLNIPVRWVSQHKPVLSGLSESSSGNGMNRRSVHHIYLEEDLSYGRLSRRSGSFLCAPSTGRHFNDCISGEGSKDIKVSCSACLKIAKRFQK